MTASNSRRKPAGKRRSKRKSKRSGWSIALNFVPRFLAFIGVIVLINVLGHLPGHHADLKYDTQLRAVGKTTSAVIESVDKVRHGARYSWYEYEPVIRSTDVKLPSVGGLSEYASSNEDTYAEGQKIRVLYNPKDLSQQGIAGDASRRRLEDQVNRDIAGLWISLALLAIGAPMLVSDFILYRKRKNNTLEIVER